MTHISSIKPTTKESGIDVRLQWNYWKVCRSNEFPTIRKRLFEIIETFRGN